MKWLQRSGLVLILIIFSLLGMLFYSGADRLQDTAIAPPLSADPVRLSIAHA